MKVIYLFTLLILTINCSAQQQDERAGEITYHINSNIKNSDADYFIEITSNWKEYLNSAQYVRAENQYWNYEGMNRPDYTYVSLLIELISVLRDGGEMQCTFMGLIPVQKDYYQLKTMYSNEVDGVTDINHIISVYVKEIDGKYQFHNGVQYHKEIYGKRKAGDINYIVHSDHEFVQAQADKMNVFNKEIASLFEMEPLPFDYVVANTTTDLSEITGLNFFSYSYQPVQSGGMTDNYNRIILAGNNSEYYPHEVVHLYTNAKYPRQYHPWVDEGIAAFFGGSTGYELDWHLQKLKEFLAEDLDFEMTELSVLETQIPNGEHMTDFRYAIGGFVMKTIYEKEGMAGLFESLQAGRSEEDYYELLQHKLGIKRSEFGSYIRKELGKLEALTPDEMKALKY